MTVSDVYSLLMNFLFTHWLLDMDRAAELAESCWWFNEAGAD